MLSASFLNNLNSIIRSSCFICFNICCNYGFLCRRNIITHVIILIVSGQNIVHVQFLKLSRKLDIREQLSSRSEDKEMIFSLLLFCSKWVIDYCLM